MLRTRSNQRRLKSLLWLEASLVGVLAVLLLSVSEARRALQDVRLAVSLTFQRWEAHRQLQQNLHNEIAIGTQVTELQNAVPQAKLLHVIAAGTPSDRVIHLLREQLQRQSKNRLLSHLVIIASDENTAGKLRSKMSFPNLSVRSDPSGALHRRLNAFFTPRWYIFSSDGVLLKKQEPDDSIGQCGCGQR